MDYAWDVAENCQKNINPEVLAKAYLQEHA
jgi:hypothetical protein